MAKTYEYAVLEVNSAVLRLNLEAELNKKGALGFKLLKFKKTKAGLTIILMKELHGC